MRMRRKRNLEERLDAHSRLLLARGRPCLNLKKAAEEYRALLDFPSVFGNDRPVCLEVGCGNGGFIAETARRNPLINFLAVEICSNVIVTAIERIAREEIENVRFLNIPAEILPCYLDKGSIGRVYLNFSTPLPEKTREKQRLTSPRFLAIYRDLLRNGGEVVQKTDSEQFFDYSLQQFEENGFRIRALTRDLHGSEYAADNVETEYEKNFSSKGMPIYMAIAVKTPQGDDAAKSGGKS